MKVSPDPDKLEEAADRLLAIHESMGAGNAVVDFGKTGFGHDDCGTVACHGGWLVPALSGDITAEGVGLHRHSTYSVGTEMMDEWLGWPPGTVDDGERFPTWARENPGLWGNEDGGGMYGLWGNEAFGAPRNRVTLETIAAWYKDVAKRIRGSENED